MGESQLRLPLPNASQQSNGGHVTNFSRVGSVNRLRGFACTLLVVYNLKRIHLSDEKIDSGVQTTDNQHIMVTEFGDFRCQ
jgi:hypothetical protein